MFQNHHKSAMKQLSCGLYLFCEWQAGRTNRNEAQTNSALSFPNEERDLEIQLSHIFNRLLTQSLLFSIRRLDKRLLFPELTPTRPRVPDKFDTPDQARDSFNDCMGSMLRGVKSRSLTPGSHSHQPASTADKDFLRQWTVAFTAFRAGGRNKLTDSEQWNCILLEMQQLAVYLWALSSSPFPALPRRNGF
jgi:hypothetical protein